MVLLMASDQKYFYSQMVLGNSYVDKKYLFYLCFSLVFGNSLPLRVGETLLYNASFRGIHAASASLKTIKKEVIGTDSVYHIQFIAKSEGPINYIFPIDDEINLWIDIKTFLPIKFMRK